MSIWDDPINRAGGLPVTRKMFQTDAAITMPTGLEIEEVVHDLRNLLASIGMFAELGRAQSPDGSPSGGTFGQILTACIEAGELSDTLATPDHRARAQQRRERLDLAKMVEDSGSLLAASVNEATRLKIEITAGPVVVAANPFHVRRILMNLVLNASQALEGRPGLVVVSTGACDLDKTSQKTIVAGNLLAGRYSYLEVTDSGCGMDAAAQTRLFEPHITRRHTGHGLGMSSVQRIVIAHGGAIQIQSRRGAGTRVRVLFPRAEPQESDLRASGDGSVDESRRFECATVGTVLLVDDDRSIRMMSEVMLESRGWSVVTATSGEEAIRVLQRHPGQISAVVLDMLLSGMNGAETLRQIRQIDPDLPVIILSGSNQHELMNRFDNEFPHAFLSKPFSVDDLVDVISSATTDAAASRNRPEQRCRLSTPVPGTFDEPTLNDASPLAREKART